jgi:hypothetical protein
MSEYNSKFEAMNGPELNYRQSGVPNMNVNRVHALPYEGGNRDRSS